MSARVVRLGAWCDIETEDEARDRLLAARASTPAPVPGEAPRPGLYTPRPGERILPPGLSFRVEEFAVLTDGRRLVLDAGRGFGLSMGATVGEGELWRRLTPAGLRSDVLTTVLPDDAEATGEQHPWEWLARRLRVLGVEVTGGVLRRLPYDVEFSDRVRTALGGT